MIEVAVTTRALDESKAGIYAEAGIREYWIVRPEDRSVDIYREPSGDRCLSRQTLSEGDVIVCTSITELALPIAEFLPDRLSTS